MLASSSIQAQPVLGESFDYGTQTGLTGFFTQADEKTAFELCGTLETLDEIAVVAVAQFASNNLPVVMTNLTRFGVTLRIRALKFDQSAYILGLKMISPAGP